MSEMSSFEKGVARILKALPPGERTYFLELLEREPALAHQLIESVLTRLNAITHKDKDALRRMNHDERKMIEEKIKTII